MEQNSLEINSCKHGQLIFDPGAKNKQWERTVSLLPAGVGRTGQPHAKE